MFSTTPSPHEDAWTGIRCPSSSDLHDSLSVVKTAASQEITPSFVCTICWQPRYPVSYDSPYTFDPVIPGLTETVLCRDCWCTVLDLSICWVCGEFIIRGHEVISLGWCFWHRSCFGCLVCGYGLCIPSNCVVPNEALANLEEVQDMQDSSQERSNFCIELEAVPLCNPCQLDITGERGQKDLQSAPNNLPGFEGDLNDDRSALPAEDVVELEKPAGETPERDYQRPRG